MPKHRYIRTSVQSYAGVTSPLVLIFASVVLTLWVLIGSYSTYAAGLSFGFGGGTNVTNGMIVSVDRDDTNSVVQAHVNNADYVVGVSVDRSSSAIVFDNNDSVYVATEGVAGVFVSTLSGDIEPGDLIAVSPIGGVGQKKVEGASGQKIVGIANSAFSMNAANAEKISLPNNGDVYMGLIEIEILVSGSTDTQQDDEVSALVKIGNRIAGKPVSLGQVVITAIVMIVAFVVSGALLFGSIKGSFTSIGRNPLSASMIYRGMVRASFISLGVMVLGVAGGYAVLIL